MGMNKEKIFCCLKDIVCSSMSIEQFLMCYESKDVQGAIRILKKERCQLIEKLHQEQQKIDCLDYLLCQIKKENL